MSLTGGIFITSCRSPGKRQVRTGSGPSSRHMRFPTCPPGGLCLKRLVAKTRPTTLLRKERQVTHPQGLEPPERESPVQAPTFVQACFSSILQGDHLGVEHATCAHAGLLMSRGLLDFHSRLVAHSPVVDAVCHDGLIIDDYFAIAKVPRAEHDCLEPSSSTSARERLETARQLYRNHGLEGSPEKDIENAKVASIAGAEVDSRTATLDRQLCLVGVPRSKRLALADLTLDLCALPGTSDALHACIMGSWSSVFTFRRPCFCAFSSSFALVQLSELDPQRPRVLPLPRRCAEELQLAAALAPVACSDVAAPFASRLYATDASEERGAFCSAPLPGHLRTLAWSTADRKGGYARIASPARVLLKRADPWWEDEEDEPPGAIPVSRPLGFLFDALFLGKGARAICSELKDRGWTVGPLLDSFASPFFTLCVPRLLEWIFYLIEEDRVRCIYIVPPLGSRDCPGLGRSASADPSPRVSRQDCLWVFRSLAVLLKARLADVAAVIQVPAEAPCHKVEVWKRLRGLSGSSESVLHSCVFGSPFRKALRVLSVGCSLHSVARPCTCSGHKRVQGRYGKAFAPLTPGLSFAIGSCLDRELRAKNSRLESADLRIEGLERVAAADLALSLDWRTERSWPWKGRVHINILHHLPALSPPRPRGRPLAFCQPLRQQRCQVCGGEGALPFSGPSALGPPGLFDQPCCRPLSWWPLLPH